MQQLCDLKKCFFCSNSLPEWREAICNNKKNRILKKGETLFSEGDEVTEIYFVYSGTVKVHKKWGDNKELIIRFASNGSILGHRGLINDKVYSVSATAVEPVMVCSFDLEFFKWSLRVNYELSYNLMMFFAEELGAAEQNMHDLALLPAKERILKALLKLQQQFGCDDEGYIAISLPRQDIAQYAGTTYETLFRTLMEMQDEGSVVLDGKRIKIIREI